MDGPLLSTKLHTPARRASSVRRGRLTDRLAAPGRLVLIAAPAGFGKTSVLTDWISELQGSRVAWLSLDARDNDATRFWRYVLSAVERAHPGAASGARALWDSASVPIEAVLSTLVNDLDLDGDDILIVLDDFHVIDNPAIHEAMTFLLDGLPANAHLVIASRADPPLPLGRLRARGDLIELRAADLRFSPTETFEYLGDAMGLVLGADDVATLGERTEGWIAALQLAALSLRGRPDPSAFISGFAGDDRYVVDYLVEEVLHRQTDATRAFLLQTSILGRLSGDLCDAVTATTGGTARLASLDRENLFLVPLDDQREWYRYHHLFADMLRARLLDEQPDQARDLHGRASDWFERHGLLADAIAHAIDAGAFERAGGLIKAAMPGMQQQRQETTLAGWFDRLPAAVVQSDPELGVGFAGVLLSAGRTDGVDRLLRDAEAAAGGASDDVVAIRRGIALYRSAQALTDGDFEAALEQSDVAIALATDGSHLDRGSSHGVRGLVLWALGELEEARTAWAISLDELEHAGHLADVLGGSIAMGDILIALGRLTDAEATYAHALDIATISDPPLRGTADMHVGMADLLRERGDLEAARRHLASAEALGEYAGLPQNRHRRRMAVARLLRAEGDAAAGIAVLDEAAALYTPDFFPEVQPIPALRARLLITAGRTSDALDGMRRRRVAIGDNLSYLAEFDHITLVRVLLADAADPRTGALDFLDRILEAAERGGRRGSMIELLALRSLARRTGRRGEELDDLARAVELAEPEGYVRVFADEGLPMARLLETLVKRSGSTPYLRRLVSATRSSGVPARPTGGGLLEPLSDRELDVLRLLASDLSGPEIARHLVVSLNTLRSHTQHIYTKLGATSRREAIRRATDLGLLDSPR